MLIQTGDAFLFEVIEDYKEQQNNDVDWGFGMGLNALVQWTRREQVSPLALAFFTMHPACEPGCLGSNMTGRLLMELRSQLLEAKNDVESSGKSI